MKSLDYIFRVKLVQSTSFRNKYILGNAQSSENINLNHTFEFQKNKHLNKIRNFELPQCQITGKLISIPKFESSSSVLEEEKLIKDGNIKCM